MLKTWITVSAVLLILLGIAHAVHVARSNDVEPYLWIASIALAIQGVLTLVYLRRDKR